MHRHLLCALVASVLGLSLVAVPHVSAEQASRRTASLRITPEVFVGGQALTFVGTLADAPNSRVVVQTRFNRTGDTWTTRGYATTTDARGDYAFVYPAPNNFGISYRVRAGNGATSPAVVLEPRQQEAVLSLNGGAEQAPGTVVSGTPFRIDVNSTPTGRGDLGRPAPAFPGRRIDLQQRVHDDLWQTVATTTSSLSGTASFVLTAGAPGATAYRVRLDDIRTDGNQIGWFPSFPLEVRVAGPRASARAAAAPDAAAASPAATVPAAREAVARPGTSTAAPTSARGQATPLASQRYRWGPSQFDFAWEEGESLTDKPFRGTRRTGAWQDTSDGSGRVAHYNGGMALSSNVSEFPGDGDHGTTTATLAGNAMTYGRWEFRRRIDVFENAGTDYRIGIDLVPADAQDVRCGANIVHVAEVGFNSPTAQLGVSSARADTQWSGSVRIPQMADGPHSFGIEITRSHITWFLDGQSLATVKDRKAAPGVPLTPRLSLIGHGDDEMRRTRVLYDWQRGWPLNKQALRAEAGPRLKPAPLSGGC